MRERQRQFLEIELSSPSHETVDPLKRAKRPWEAGEFWALLGVVAYALSFILDRTAVSNADPMVGPVIFGLPSLALGILMVLIKRTYRQLQSDSPLYIGRRTIITFVIPGVLSFVGLLAYYFALKLGGVR